MKYLYERKTSVNMERILFNSSEELFEYLQEKGERIFNNGFNSADISLYRVEEYEKFQ